VVATLARRVSFKDATLPAALTVGAAWAGERDTDEGALVRGDAIDGTSEHPNRCVFRTRL
jgi:hypothetical protein